MSVTADMLDFVECSLTKGTKIIPGLDALLAETAAESPLLYLFL